MLSAFSSLKEFAKTQFYEGPLGQALPTSFRETAFLRAIGLFKIPLIFYVSPTVLELSEEKCVIRIPLGWRTKNHLGAMYFGSLCVGADMAGGVIAARMIHSMGADVSLVFKDFQAEFLKRAEGDVHFTCTQGQEIRALVVQALESAERVSQKFQVTATVPSKLGNEPVAQFFLTLSLKRKK